MFRRGTPTLDAVEACIPQDRIPERFSLLCNLLYQILIIFMSGNQHYFISGWGGKRTSVKVSEVSATERPGNIDEFIRKTYLTCSRKEPLDVKRGDILT
ncbi:hypothetical protein Aduo_002517 [Ancylostoma duodenale]